jgi:Zn-dependent M28 family amino/carboxypeptidase
MRFIAFLFSALAAAAAFAGPATRRPAFDGATWWHDVQTIADDRFEGRETGSPGEAAAQRWLTGELRRLGLKPAGERGFLQPVELRSRTLVEGDSSLVLVRDGTASPVALGDEAILSTRVDLAPEVEAPLVFAGYGLRSPEAGWDDFAGLDVHGKVVVVLSGSPESMSPALAAHLQSTAVRMRTLRSLGAAGLVTVQNPASMDVPWSRIAANRLHPSMVLADPALDDAAGVHLSVAWNPDRAERLFEGSGHTFAELAALGRERKPVPRFALTGSLRARTKLVTAPVHSANVVAMLPGRDPALRKEYVVLSAHLDHLGLGAPVNGDRLYNGAMDNGSGSALLLDVARVLAREGRRPARSLLFVWVTAEEKGLLGSRWFARHPTVPAESLVANVNVDMFLPIVPLKLVTVYGLEESDLGEHARRVIERAGLTVQPDPEPLRNIFVRSDQYSFIRRGVPALSFKIGAEPDSPEAKTLKDWLTERYHAPSDDPAQPVDLSAAAGFEQVVHDLLLEVADAPARPAWRESSFFRRFARAPD